jgi:hypothetical protein
MARADHETIGTIRHDLAFRLEAVKRLDPKLALLLPVEDAVLRDGRDYIGIGRPKGFRHQRPRQQCFWNAADAALQGRGQYEGER